MDSFHRSMFFLVFGLFVSLRGLSVWACEDTIPLQAQQIATRTVELQWSDAGQGVVTTVFRRYPGETAERQIAVTTDNYYVDRHGRAVCDDTVYYSISQNVAGVGNSGFAAVNVIDMEPTAVASWGLVTVDEATQTIVLQWEASPDSDIMGYLVMEGTPSMVADTVFGRTNTQYTASRFSTDSIYHFRICAFDSCLLAAALTDACNNVVVRLESQPCSREVTARWNHYENMPGGVDHYELWASEDGGPFRQVATAVSSSSPQTVFEVSEQAMSVQVYVKAVGGQYVSLSNRDTVTFSTAERPAYFYLRKVSTSDDGSVVTVMAQTDPQFPGSDYTVYRSVDGGPVMAVAHCQPQSDGTLEWRDLSARPKEAIYSYCFGVVDGCGRNEMKTRMGSTLLLHIDEQGLAVVVGWNGYEGWTGTTEYALLESPIGEEQWTPAGATTAQEVVVSDNGQQGSGRCYKVVAAEGLNSQYQRGDTLQSAVFSHRPVTEVWMPNAFTPTENSNNRFGPQFLYVDAVDYRFVIFNRQGLEVFRTTDPSAQWDGKKDGILMPEGAYVYMLSYRKGDGTVQHLKGTVTIIY